MYEKSKNKIILKRIFFVLLTGVIIVGMTYILSKLVERKTSVRKYADFFHTAQDIDVLWVGTSHVINGIFPMEIYDDFGITSYNFGNDASTMAMSYWTIMNAIDYASPKLIVLDMYGISSLTKVNNVSFDYIHSAFDAFPISRNKIEMAYDITNDAMLDELIQAGDYSDNSKGSPLQVLFNYSVYHNRWNDMKWYDFNVNFTPEKGADSRIGVAKPNNIAEYDGSFLNTNNISFVYLNKIIEECKSRDIQLMFIYLPYPSTISTYREIKAAAKIADEHNIEFIDLISENVVNYGTDMFDSISHLNPSGARKVSHYLGEYISNKYGLVNHKISEDSISSSWNEEYKKYLSFKNSNIRCTSDASSYLMLLSDSDYEIHISETKAELQSSRYLELIQNIDLYSARVFYSSDMIVEDGSDLNVEVFDVVSGQLVDIAYIRGNSVNHK